MTTPSRDETMAVADPDNLVQTAEDYSQEVAAARAQAQRYRLEYVDMDEFRIDQELFRSIPADLMLRYGFVPHRRDGKWLVIVVSDPTDLPMIDELSVQLGTPLRVTVGARSSIQSILKKSESSQRVLEDATAGFQLQVLKEDEAADERHQPHHPPRGLDDLHRHSAPRERHSHRDGRRRRARQVPD
jgi:type II secretory ATPase GspE/PulE/Tfp pilus assembly ATPase PilB-like protein